LSGDPKLLCPTKGRGGFSMRTWQPAPARAQVSEIELRKVAPARPVGARSPDHEVLSRTLPVSRQVPDQEWTVGDIEMPIAICRRRGADVVSLSRGLRRLFRCPSPAGGRDDRSKDHRGGTSNRRGPPLLARPTWRCLPRDSHGTTGSVGSMCDTYIDVPASVLLALVGTALGLSDCRGKCEDGRGRGVSR
jgi:hypothetical protein